MGDPAVEAVERATNGPVNGPVSAFCLASVREFAEPIRDLHHRVNGEWGPYCATCWGPGGRKGWPCTTALLIYTTEELRV